MARNLIILAVTIILGAGLTYMLDYSGAGVPKSASVQTPAAITNKAAPLPDFSFTPLGQKQPINTASLQGKIIIMNFWASWCAPCVKEFPYFLQLAAEFPDDVVFMGLSSDHDNDAMNRFLDKLRSDYPAEMALDNVLIAMDEGGSITRGTFQTFRLPETILIDRDGLMQEKLIGANWEYNDLKALVQKFDAL